jgi:hypothetical protein
MVLVRAIAGAALALSLTATPAHGAPQGAVDSAPCITFDTHGYRYIAFARAGVAEPGIYLATNRSGRWRLSPHPVTPGDRCPAITVDAAGHVHLLATRPLPADPNGNYDLYYATNKSGSWRASKVHYGEVGVASLAIDRTGRANIAISDEDGVFVYRRAASGGWLNPYATGGVPSHLRVDPAGTLWLIVRDVSHLRFLRLMNRSGDWMVSQIPLRYSKTVTVDLGIDAAGRRFLVAHNGTTGDLSIYRDLGGSWPRVGRTQTKPGRFLLEATSEPSGAIHLLLLYARSPTATGVVDQNRHGGSWQTQLVGYTSGSAADIDVDRRGRVGGAFVRDGVIWSYWNNWIGTPHRFRVSDL